DSAGATLAAVVCQMAATAGRPPLAAQLLICPILDACAVTDSRRAFAEGHLLDQATLDHDLAHYLAADVDRTDARVSPLRAAQLQRLPPTCIHTAEFDPLRDEGAAYAERLRLASAGGWTSCVRCLPTTRTSGSPAPATASRSRWRPAGSARYVPGSR